MIVKDKMKLGNKSNLKKTVVDIVINDYSIIKPRFFSIKNKKENIYICHSVMNSVNILNYITQLWSAQTIVKV